MEILQQRDPRWANIKLGFGTTTIGSHGCFLTDLSMMAGITPDKANEILKKAGAFNKDLIISDKAAKALGLEYYPPPRSEAFNCSHTCIAEVDFNPATTTKEQHFVVLQPDGTQLDSWTGKTSKYRIISIRVFRNPNFEENKEKHGIDISHWNKVTDWDKIKKDFVICKCTQGTTYLDPTYQENIKQVKNRGMICGAYHFANGSDAKKEAQWFLKNAGQVDLMVLDWEIEHSDPVGWCKEFIKEVGDCWLYTNDARALKHGFPKEWKKWIARYKDYSGDLDWDYQPKSEWDIWQYTSRGVVDGIDGNVDLNIAKNLIISEQPMNKEVKEWAEAREKNQGLSTKEDWWQYAYDKKIEIEELEKDIENMKETIKAQNETLIKLEKTIEIQTETIEDLEKALRKAMESMQEPVKPIQEPIHEFNLFGFIFRLYKNE